MRPLVSILIPVYNAERWVDRAIGSALAQTWPEKEIIVLDDGSTDRSLDIVRKFAPEVRVESGPNCGQNVSRNRLTAMSSGEWLVYLDADDELAPDSVQQKMNAVDGADAAYGDIEVACYVGKEKTRSSICAAPKVSDPFVAAFHWAYPNTSAFLFRKSAILKVGGWNTEISNCTDYAMYFQLLLDGKRFQPARNAFSIYRQWSATQAVYENPLRKSSTRLQLLWRAAKELHASDRLTPERKEAFERAAFGVIRTIAQLDRDQGLRQHSYLAEWNANFCPANCGHLYQIAYSFGGFAFAEWLADWGRRFNPIKRPPPGIDPQSGLPYV